MIPRRSAFTLLEVLVTVAILAILAAILIPTVSLVRASANSASCLGNLHTIGVGALQYSADNKGLIIPDRTQPGSARYYWVGLLAPYLGAPSADAGFGGAENKSPYMCPTAQENNTGLTYYALPVSTTVSYYTRYDINPHITSYYSGDLTTSQTYRSGHMNQMENPAKTYLFMDLFGAGGGGYWAVNSGRLTYPHSNTVHVLFLDGHTEAKTPAEMQYYASNPYHIFWRGYDWGYPGYIVN